MDFLELAEKRFSVRKFQEKRVTDEDIKKILKAGYLAPTACNLQPQKILVINDNESITKLRKCTKSHFNCLTAMLVCYDKLTCWKREYDDKTSGEIDASIVCTHMMLEAANIGVGSTWVMHFIPEAIKEEFQLPDNIEAVAILVLGYPSEDVVIYPSHNKFRPINEIVKYNKL